jgi:hypothetical protein
MSPVGGQQMSVEEEAAMNHVAIVPDAEKLNLGFIQVGTKRRIQLAKGDPRKHAKTNSIYSQSSVTEQLTTVNRFDVLASAEANEEPMQTTVNTEKVECPPPIHLSEVDNFSRLVELITTVVGSNFRCKAGTNTVSIYTENMGQYRQLVRFLREKNASFHTYQAKDDKAHRVVLRGIHWTTPAEQIKEELTALQFQVRSVVNVISRWKTPLPLFFVDLEPKSNYSEIYNITRLVHSVVQVEEARQNHQIKQCSRCLSFNHTKAYCNHAPRCLKCAEFHLTSACEKSKDLPAKCALCGESHTANYRGCNVYQQLQRRRRLADPSYRKDDYHAHDDLQNRNVNQQQPRTYYHQQQWQKRQNHQQSEHYQSTQPNQPTNQPTNNSNKQGGNAPYVNARTPYISYASKVSGEHHSNPTPDLNSLSSLTKLLTDFITDIKNMIMPMVTMLAQVTQSLITHHGK